MGDGYNVVVCKHCGMGFADDIPSQREMDNYYTEQSKYSYDYLGGTESPWDLARFEASVNQIAAYLKSRDVRILDIGCATGGLLSVFKARGFKNLTGADPSAVCAAAANRLHGLDVRTATLAQLSGWAERFDLILLVGVLEHLNDVNAAMSIATRLLNPGGYLYCAVPDVRGLAECPNAPFQQFSVEHVNFFSKRSLGHLMTRCGLRQLCIWNWRVEWREDVVEPIVSGLYWPFAGEQKNSFDSTTERALKRYLAFSKAGDRKIEAEIERLRKTQEPILVWGAGTLARRLLATTRFSEANITAFVDSNVNIQGQVLAGRDVLGPTQIENKKERIVICSVSFAKEIAHSIRVQHRLDNPIGTLVPGGFDY